MPIERALYRALLRAVRSSVRAADGQHTLAAAAVRSWPPGRVPDVVASPPRTGGRALERLLTSELAGLSAGASDLARAARIVAPHFATPEGGARPLGRAAGESDDDDGAAPVTRVDAVDEGFAALRRVNGYMASIEALREAGAFTPRRRRRDGADGADDAAGASADRAAEALSLIHISEPTRPY